jgi:hypothetical protein
MFGIFSNAPNSGQQNTVSRSSVSTTSELCPPFEYTIFNSGDLNSIAADELVFLPETIPPGTIQILFSYISGTMSSPDSADLRIGVGPSTSTVAPTQISTGIPVDSLTSGGAIGNGTFQTPIDISSDDSYIILSPTGTINSGGNIQIKLLFLNRLI